MNPSNLMPQYWFDCGDGIVVMLLHNHLWSYDFKMSQYSHIFEGHNGVQKIQWFGHINHMV